MTTENASPVPAAPADLANLLVLAQLLKKDEELDARERERRDQDIRQALSESRNRQEHEPHLFWMQRVSAPEDAECIHAAVWHLNVALLVIGLLSGCTAILGIFFYDGTNRVSVWGVIGVFVGLQLFLIVGFAFAARSPVTRRASLAALMLSAARQAVRAIQRMLPEAGHGHHWVLEVLRPEHPYRTVAKWLVLHWSQSMAIAFNAAALVTAFALVVFTDLAFGWGSTLQISPTKMHQVVVGIATPWASVFPSAVPDEELVEISRNFRLTMGSEPVDAATAERLGGWWSFSNTLAADRVAVV